MEKEQLFSLAQKASEGDSKAFEMILEEKSRHILYNAYDILKNHHDAEDAAQEVVVKMYQYIGNLQKPENFNAWLHKIIHNVCISKLRKSKYYKNDLELDSIMDPTFNEVLVEKDREFLPHAFAEDRSLSDTLIETIRSLPKRRRRAIILYYYEDLSQKEIAEVMEISESTVASNILRAKDDIKKKLEEKTGLNIDEEMKKTAGKMATIPVLAEVLRADAVTQFGPESVAGLVNTDFSKVSDASPKADVGAQSLGVKIAAAVTAVGVVCGGIFVAADVAPSASEESQAPTTKTTVVEEVVETQMTENGEVNFAGGDCDCGHENPSSAMLVYDTSNVQGELEYTWELVDSAGGIIANGEGQSISIPKDNMTAGSYTAKFFVTDETGSVLTVERDLEIK